MQDFYHRPYLAPKPQTLQQLTHSALDLEVAEPLSSGIFNPDTLNPKSQTLNLLNPKPLNPKSINPKVINPKPLNPKPYTSPEDSKSKCSFHVPHHPGGSVRGTGFSPVGLREGLGFRV